MLVGLFFLTKFNCDRYNVPIPFEFDVDDVVDYTLSIIFCEIRLFVGMTGIVFFNFIGGG